MCVSFALHTFFSLAAVILGLPTGTTPNVPATAPQIEEACREIRTVRHRRADAAQRAVGGLNLTRQQAQRLLPIVEQAAAVRIEGYEQEALLLPEMIEAYGDFAREDRLNQGFTQSVERRTTHLHHRAKQERERITEELIALEERAAVIFAPWQRQLAEAAGPPHRRAGSRDQHAGNDRLAAAHQDLDDLRSQIHPQLSKLGQFLFHPAAAETLCNIAGTRPSQTIRQAVDVFEHGTSAYPLSLNDLQQAQVNGLREEIKNWNLLNGLHFSSEQIERITTLCDTAAPKMRASKRRGRRTTGGSQTPLAALEREVEKIMNPGQRQVLADYKPCLLPPKDLKNPVRAGQSNDSSHTKKWLARARNASGARLERLAEQLIEKEAEHFGELKPAELRKRRTLLLDTARRAGAMSDVDYELNKADLAERLEPRDRIQELTSEIGTLARAKGRPGRVAHLILKPQFIDQLRQRGEQLSAGLPQGRADLTKGPQAENCDNGCAIKY